MKRLLVVFVAMALCISFAGCEVDNLQDDKQEYQYSDLEKQLLKEDYYAAAGAVLSCKSDSANMELQPNKALTDRFPQLVQYLDQGDYDSAIGYIAELSASSIQNDALRNCISKQFTVIDGEIAVKNMIVQSDGVILLDQEKYYWVENRTDSLILILNGVGEKFNLLAQDNKLLVTDNKGTIFATATVSGDSSNPGGSADLDPSVLGKFAGEWVSLSGDVYDTVRIEQTQKGIRIYTTFFSGYLENVRDDNGVFVIDAGAGVVSISERGEKGFLAVSKDNSKQFYYRQDKGFDENWPEVSYARALKAIENLKNYNEAYKFDWLPNVLSRQEALVHCLELLDKAKEYADVSAYIDLFATMNGVIISSYFPHQYNANGQMTEGYDIAYFMRYFGWRFGFDYPRPHTFTYDSAGRVSEIFARIPAAEAGHVDYQIKFTYKSDGKLEKIIAKDNKRDIEFYTFYDMDGNLLEITGSFLDENGEEQMLWRNFGYDPESGRLNSETAWFTDGDGAFYSSVTMYEYDSKGRVVTETTTYDYVEETGNDVTDTIKYTYDANGNLTKVNATGTDGSSKEITYTYGNYYFFDGK